MKEHKCANCGRPVDTGNTASIPRISESPGLFTKPPLEWICAQCVRNATETMAADKGNVKP